MLSTIVLEIKSTSQLRSASHLACEARDFTLNLFGLSSRSEENISHERRGEERREELDMTCGNLAALLAHTGGTDHSNIMEIMLMWLPLGEIKTPVKYRPALHCHDRTGHCNNARE